MSDLRSWPRHERIETKNQAGPQFVKKTSALVAIAPLLAVAALGQEPRLILEDDFERYTNTASLLIAWPQGAGELELRSPGGGQAVMLHSGDANRRGGFSVSPSEAHNVVLTADLFDFGTNANKRATVSLHHRKGVWLEMGAVNEGGTYGVRTIRPASGAANWMAFNPAQRPVYGWHRFQAVISLSNTVVTLDLDANGKVDWTVTLAGPPPAESLTEVRFGALPDGISSGGPVLIDNVRLELVPAPPPVRTAQIGASAGATTSQAAAASAPFAASDTLRPLVAQPGDVDSGAALWWIMGALTLIIGLLAWLILALRRGAPGASTALLPPAGNPPQLTHEKALAELTEFAKQSLVQGLYEQRNALLDTQRKAQQALIQLEQRLAALQLPHQERLRAYELRIAELEKELETRGEEVRELTQATLLLVRRKLEEERGLGIRRDQFN